MYKIFIHTYNEDATGRALYEFYKNEDGTVFETNNLTEATNKYADLPYGRGHMTIVQDIELIDHQTINDTLGS